ncbi:hypothetical protein GCM10019059_34640 [Camelimonas fluminis]|uniref:DUF3164 family protein n=1 Tax=Camelimonas fluminis TaxID=1576911 RepID=A0ABV7UFT8_9HYPH|nr:DUF3164 family protein [Camelimonas fluminis]GHE72127.1 hypothetical protein GCM10019059_34640 [Camelimonas fluminis]
MNATGFETRAHLTGRIAALENALKETRKHIINEMDALLEACDELEDGTPILETMGGASRHAFDEASADLKAIDALLDAGRPDAPQDGVFEVGGQNYMRDTKGNLIPVATIKPQHLLQDEMVRKIINYASEQSAQVRRFLGHTFGDLNALQTLLEQEYGAPKGGAKGNVTYQSFDGLMKVQVQIADVLDFGPELQPAKGLIDECLMEWGAESRPELRAIVNTVFSVEKEGHINRSGLFQLLRMEVDDHRWKRAMDALRDAIRIVGAKRYVRFFKRPATDAAWEPIIIDLARA